MLLFLKLNQTQLNIYDVILYYIRIWFTCEYGDIWFLCEYYEYLSKEEPLDFSLAIQQLLTIRKVRAVGTRSSLLLWDWLCHFFWPLFTQSDLWRVTSRCLLILYWEQFDANFKFSDHNFLKSTLLKTNWMTPEKKARLQVNSFF